MDKKVVVITSGHPPLDERIFYKFGCTLAKNTFRVTVISSTQELKADVEGITINSFDGRNITFKNKINIFRKMLQEYEPDIIICCEPLPILAAHKYKKHNNSKTRIISDITEWYPENVALKLKGVKRIVSYILLYIFNIYCTNLADALIIGEKNKKGRYDIIAPYKEKIVIGYYPVLKFFNYYPPKFSGLGIRPYIDVKSVKKKVFTLCYAGLISFERGIILLTEAALAISKKYPSLNLRLKIMGKFQSKIEEDIFNARIKSITVIEIERIDFVPYREMSKYYEDVDLCFDLRKLNFIYRNSLPIKIFEYMACGKPFIFSEAPPIKKEMNAYEFGTLVNPNKQDVINSISNYIDHPDLLMIQSENARKAVETLYNWENLEIKLTDFITRLTRT